MILHNDLVLFDLSLQTFVSSAEMILYKEVFFYVQGIIISNSSHLCSFNWDDPVQRSGGVVEEGDVDGGGGRGQPGPLRLRVDVENVRFASENRLLPVKQTNKHFRDREIRQISSTRSAQVKLNVFLPHNWTNQKKHYLYKCLVWLDGISTCVYC